MLPVCEGLGAKTQALFIRAGVSLEVLWVPTAEACMKSQFHDWVAPPFQIALWMFGGGSGPCGMNFIASDILCRVGGLVLVSAPT